MGQHLLRARLRPRPPGRHVRRVVGRARPHPLEDDQPRAARPGTKAASAAATITARRGASPAAGSFRTARRRRSSWTSQSPKDKRTLYVGLLGEGVFKSVDDGKTWTAKNKGLGTPNNMNIWRLDLHKDGTLLCGESVAYVDGKPIGGALWRSTDGAESWSKVNATQPFDYIWGVRMDPRDSKVIYVSCFDVPPDGYSAMGTNVPWPPDCGRRTLQDDRRRQDVGEDTRRALLLGCHVRPRGPGHRLRRNVRGRTLPERRRRKDLGEPRRAAVRVSAPRHRGPDGPQDALGDHVRRRRVEGPVAVNFADSTGRPT